MNSELQKLCEIRDYRESDKAFVLSTFLRGLYYGDSWFSLIPKDIFMDNYKLVGDVLLKKYVVKVACLKEDPDVILGYSILGTDYQTIHWVYVKSAWRKQGVAKSLLPKYPTAVTHMTALGKILLPKFEHCVFNPFKI